MVIKYGLTWAADKGAHVANISYGVTGSSTVTSAAKYFMDKGGVTTMSAGNSGGDPGFSDNFYMISVSATNSISAPPAGIPTTVTAGE